APVGPARVGDVRCGGARRDGGQVWRDVRRGLADGQGTPLRRGARHPDEHARAHGADRPERRTGPGRHFAGAVHDDGADGRRHHARDDARVAAGLEDTEWKLNVISYKYEKGYFYHIGGRESALAARA